MAEFVQRHLERQIEEKPILENLFKSSVVRRILKERLKFEYRLMRRNKQKTDFTHYITFLKSVIDDVKKMGPLSIETVKLVGMHNKRIISLYNGALKYFKHDMSLWKQYMSFLMDTKRTRMLSMVIDKALRLYGNCTDELHVFAIKNVKNMTKVRELYTCGLHIHKFSPDIYLEAFIREIDYSGQLVKKVLASGDELNPTDPALNGAVAHIIFKTAREHIVDHYRTFLKMLHKASEYSFALDIVDEIKEYMGGKFSADPNFWDELARSELTKKSLQNKQRIKNCFDMYDEALLLIDTDDMWDSYLTCLLEVTSDTDKAESYKRDLLRCSMRNAHKKKKMKPIHYIEWLNKSTSSMHEEILNLAMEAHPNDTSILEVKLKKLIDTDKLSAYELFKQKRHHVSHNMWLTMVKYCLTEPQKREIFDIVFGQGSVCAGSVKHKLANEYLCWLYKNKSLNEARNVYNELILLHGNRDASLCKTLVTIEIEQQKIDISKIRQHFTLACMEFGKTNVDLWMDRICFELKYGSSKNVSSIYHQALTTLNNNESDKFAEKYTKKAHTFNGL